MGTLRILGFFFLNNHTLFLLAKPMAAAEDILHLDLLEGGKAKELPKKSIISTFTVVERAYIRGREEYGVKVKELEAAKQECVREKAEAVAMVRKVQREKKHQEAQFRHIYEEVAKLKGTKDKRLEELIATKEVLSLTQKQLESAQAELKRMALIKHQIPPPPLSSSSLPPRMLHGNGFPSVEDIAKRYHHLVTQTRPDMIEDLEGLTHRDYWNESTVHLTFNVLFHAARTKTEVILQKLKVDLAHGCGCSSVPPPKRVWDAYQLHLQETGYVPPLPKDDFIKEWENARIERSTQLDTFLANMWENCWHMELAGLTFLWKHAEFRSYYTESIAPKNKPLFPDLCIYAWPCLMNGPCKLVNGGVICDATARFPK